jgi:hypothetical protein
MIPMGATRHLRWGDRFTLLVVGILVVGCNQGGDDLPRQPIWGTVTFEGKPLAKGMIQFQPATTEAVSAGALIDEGRYSIDRSGGLVPGTYKVIINASEGGRSAAPPKDQQAGKPRPVPKELIPRKYNAQTTLTVEVKKGEERSFDFDLKP